MNYRSPDGNPVPRSLALYEAALALMPGGVSSPVRAFKAVGGTPRFMVRGEGAWMWDVDGHRYLDCLGAWGPLLLGHRPPAVVAAIQEVLAEGWVFGTPCPREIELARRVQKFYPSLEKMRFVNSGTEATLAAVRLARGATGRELIVKIAGGYHGHGDTLLMDAGSGVATFASEAGSPGIPEALVRLVRNVPFGDAAALEQLFAAEGPRIAAFILEPVCGNMGVVTPPAGYLQTARELCTRHGALLIFDEVMIGFRIAAGGAQEIYGVIPDLTCLGKIIGGGLPVAAYGGRADLLSRIAPEGPVYQAGTLSGNPLGMAAGIAMLDALAELRPWPRLGEITTQLADELRAQARRHGLAVQVNAVPGMFTIFFTATPVTDFTTAKTSDAARYGRFFQGLLERGVHFPPSRLEAAFLSAAFGEVVCEHLLAATDGAFAALAAG